MAARGASVRSIARRLRCSRATVDRDLAAIRAGVDPDLALIRREVERCAWERYDSAVERGSDRDALRSLWTVMRLRGLDRQTVAPAPDRGRLGRMLRELGSNGNAP